LRLVFKALPDSLRPLILAELSVVSFRQTISDLIKFFSYLDLLLVQSLIVCLLHGYCPYQEDKLVSKLLIVDKNLILEALKRF
jgi:hypothetical protein